MIAERTIGAPGGPGPARREAPSRTVRLLASLVRAVLATIGLAFAMSLFLLFRAAVEQDRVVAAASEQTLVGLVTLQARRLAATVRDYAHWDEAIDRVPGGYDVEWWVYNAGDFVVEGFELSFSLAVTGDDRPMLLSTASEGTETDVDAHAMTPSLVTLFDEARGRTGAALPDDAVAVGVVEFRGGLHLAAATTFRPEADDSPANPDPLAVLVFASHLEGGVLAEAAAIMGVDDLRVDDGVANDRGVDARVASGRVANSIARPVTTTDGTIAGTITWTPPRPGRSLIEGMFVPFVATFAALALFVLFFATRARKLETALRDEDKASRELAARNQSILESAGEGIFGVDASGVAIFANTAALDAIGYRGDDFLGRDPHTLIECDVHPDVRHAVDDCPIRHVLGGGDPLTTDGQQFRHRDGSHFPVEYFVTPVKHVSQVIGAVVVFRDITQRRQTEAEIRYRAHYDALTGLPNRSLIVDRLTQALARSKRTEGSVGVIFLDLDHFKEVNDSLGHDAGDLLLNQAAGRLEACVRQTDTVGRLGGDEFVVLLPDIRRPGDVAVVAEKILAALGARFDLNGHEAWVGASIGLAIHPGDGDVAADLIHHADLAMYRAKEEGRNTFRFYQRAMTTMALERRSLELDLRHAIDNDQLVLHYQPIVGLGDRRLVQVEALVRWQHPARGLIMPDDFLPLAEETGLIANVGLWVLDEGCRQLAAWRADGREVDLAINISGRQLPKGLPLDAVQAALRTHGIPASSLLFEITESVLVGHNPATMSWLEGARNLGVRLVLDDFGTGYSSLGYLNRLALHALKIDRTFIADLMERDEQRALVTAILSMARALGVDVVAEGIESTAQLAWLREHGCGFGQGYLIARPKPADAVMGLSGTPARLVV